MDILNTCIKCGICEKSCPLGISSKKIIELYRQNKNDELIEYLYSLNPFSVICSYVCPEEFCKYVCPKDIDIQELHKHFSKPINIIKNQVFNKGKIAIVGGGISGLTTAWYLLNNGYEVDLWDNSKELGGELNLIPESRLPREIIKQSIKSLIKNSHFKHVGLQFMEVDELSYDKVIYCCGCKPKELKDIQFIGHGYEYYDKFLLNPSENKNIAIIGGGKVALDCALHNQGKSTIFIRRNYWDMKLTKKEFEILLEKKIRVISNFKPSLIQSFSPNEIELTGYITLPNDMLQKETFEFDKVIIAIGKEPIKVKTENGIIIQPSNTVVETIANTIKQLENYFKK